MILSTFHLPRRFRMFSERFPKVFVRLFAIVRRRRPAHTRLKIIFCGRDSGRKKWNKRIMNAERRIMNAERRIMQGTGHTRFLNHFFLGAKRPKKNGTNG